MRPLLPFQANAVERLGEMTADQRRILGREHAAAMKLEQIDRRRDRFGGRVERPAQMLARMPPADRHAMMGEHLVVQRLDQIELHVDKGGAPCCRPASRRAIWPGSQGLPCAARPIITASAPEAASAATASS